MEFLTDLPGRQPILVLAALLPAALTWWSNRALARNPADPLLSERLFAARARARSAMVLVWVLCFVLGPDEAVWLLVLAIVMRAAAAYPLRRVLHQESWSLPAYLWFFTRLIVAFFGFWIALLWTPELVGLAGRADWIAAVFVAALLLLWNDRHTDFVRFTLRTKPIDDPPLTASIARLVGQSRVSPRFEIAPTGGGVMVNAVALPSRRGPAVVMTSTLVERFDRDEIVAVCGHELAHIEHYSGRRLRGLYAATCALIAAAVLLEPVVRIGAPDVARSYLFVWWAVAVLAFQALRVRSRQKHETESDARAVELTGDADGLMRALIKLHEMARLPRRWEGRFERHASHPSLARRIKAIRDAAGRSTPALGAPETFICGPVSVTLDRDRLQWSEAELSHGVSYRRLTELRVVAPQGAARAAAARLVAVDRGGQRWTFALDPADVPRAQRALDIVDGQLADGPAPPAVNAAIVRMVALVTGALALPAGQLAIIVPIVLAVVQPSAPLVAGAGTAAVATALLVWRDGLMSVPGWTWWAFTIGVCGCALLAFAWGARKDAAPSASKALVVLSLSTVAAWAMLFAGGGGVVRFHQMAAALPSATVLPAALAAALASMPRRSLRRAAAPILLAGIFVFAAGSSAFLESSGGDRFIGRGPGLQMTEVRGGPESEVVLPLQASTLRMSPNARFVAITDDDDDDDRPQTFRVGPAAGPFADIECDDLYFIDDAQLMTVTRKRDVLVLRVVRADADRKVVWERRLEHMRAAQVSVNATAGRWSVLGLTSGGDVARVEGSLARADAADGVRRWRSASGGPADAGWVQPVAATRDRVLMRRTRYHANRFAYAIALLAPTASTRLESDYWIVGDEGERVLGTSGLSVDCRSFQVADGIPSCIASDTGQTTIFSLDLAALRLDAKTTFDGRLSSVRDEGNGRLAANLNGDAVVIDAGARRAWRVRADGRRRTAAVAAGSGIMATVVDDGTRSYLRTYRLQ